MIVKTMDKRVYYGNRLSDNIIIDTNGQMIASNVPIARTGTQEYMGFELSEELDANQVYLIERLPEDVFNKGFNLMLSTEIGSLRGIEFKTIFCIESGEFVLIPTLRIK